MKKLTIIFSSGFLFFASCGEVKDTKQGNVDIEPNVQIEGTYVRENSQEVKNLSTGKVVGIETIRDTLFIKKKESGYEIINSKYKLKNYDQFGWREVGGTQVLPTFQATYDKSDSSLVPVQNEFVTPLYFDISDSKLYKDNSKTHPYQKVK